MSNLVGVAAETLIKTEDGNMPILSLFDKFTNENTLPLVKTYDENSKCFIFSRPSSVVQSSVLTGYNILTNNKRRLILGINTSLLTRTDFKKIQELQLAEKLGTNGIPSHQNKEWLEAVKQESILNGGGLSFISEKAEVSYHTIRKWLRIFNMQFTKSEVASYNPIWNKGLPADMQPMYGKTHSDETRSKMKQSSVMGDKSSFWRGGVERGFRQEVFDWQYKYQNKLLKDYWNSCATCKSQVNLEIDHIKPVKKYPELAFDYSNLQILCNECHTKKSAKEYPESPNYSNLAKISTVDSLTVYSIELTKTNNYVANGLIVLSN